MRRHYQKVLCILLLVCITVCKTYAINKESDDPIANLIEKSNNWQILFEVDSYVVDESFEGNKEMLKEIVEGLSTMKNNPQYELLGIRIFGYASPDGAMDYNMKLSENRARAIKEYIIAKTGIEEYHFEIEAKGENWEELESLLEKSNWNKADLVLKLIRSTPEGGDPEFQVMDHVEYDVYQRLKNEYFTKLRSASTLETFTIKELEKKPAPVVEKKVVEVVEPTPEPAPVPEPEPVEVEKVRKKRFGISTNLIYLAYKLTPNIEGEYFFADSYSVAVSGIHRWNNQAAITTAISDDINIWNVAGEFRRWFNGDGNHEGWYMGVYGRYGEYDIQVGDFLIGDNNYRQGDNVGGGLSGGYSKKISKRRPFYLDFGLSVGADKVTYDVYEMLEDCNAFYNHIERTTLGLTRAKVAFQWRF